MTTTLEQIFGKTDANELEKLKNYLIVGEIELKEFEDKVLSYGLRLERLNMPKLALIELSRFYFKSRLEYQGRSNGR